MATFRELFLPLAGGGVISIVGGGGKTTLLFRLAHEIAAGDETVLTTTTTKILIPEREQSAKVIIAHHVRDIHAKAKVLLILNRHVTAAREYLPSQHKLIGFTGEEITELEQGGLFRWILVEADGARHRSLKVPAGHEPVIPASSRLVIAVVGLDVVGHRLTEGSVFRSRLFAEMTGLEPGERITERAVAMALSHGQGIMKGSPPGALRYVLLNKAETEERKKVGRNIARLLQGELPLRPDRVIIGSLEQDGPFESYDIP